MADVPQEVLDELPQILSNLIAADNAIRAKFVLHRSDVSSSSYAAQRRESSQ